MISSIAHGERSINMEQSHIYKPFTLLIFCTIFFLSCLSTQNQRIRYNDRGLDDRYSCQNIVSASQLWLGVPYQYGGTSMQGVDCSGYVQNIYKQVFNIDLPRTTAEIYALGTYVRGEWIGCGDLVFFKNIRGRGVDHVGIYIGNNKFTHASSSQGVVVSELNDDYYQNHFVAARHYLD